MLFIFCAIIASLVFSSLVVAAQPITVVLDGKVLEFDVPPANIDGRIMVPMRTIFEAFGATISWNWEALAVTAVRDWDNLVVQATIGDMYIIVNGIRIAMDVAPIIIDDRTLVPVRFVSEAFGAEVFWASLDNAVIISSPMPYFGDDWYGWGEWYGWEDTGDWIE